MQGVNTRATFLVSRACVPHLKRADNPHVLTLSPPISLEPRWLGPHVAYTIAKYGMALWPVAIAASRSYFIRARLATPETQHLSGRLVQDGAPVTCRLLCRSASRVAYPARERARSRKVDDDISPRAVPRCSEADMAAQPPCSAYPNLKGARCS